MTNQLTKEKELKNTLQILLDNINDMEAGLCGLLYHLTLCRALTIPQVLNVKKLIYKYVDKDRTVYLFKPYDKESRIEWLKERINELEKL